MPRILLRMLIALAVTGGAIAAAVAARPHARSSGIDGGGPEQRLEFALIDHHGRPAGHEALRGQWTLIAVGFTFCPDICPTELGRMAQVLRALGPLGERIQARFLSMDPARDAPSLLRDYVTAFDPRIVGLTAAPDATAAVLAAANRLGATAVVDADPTGRGHYLINHTVTIFLIDPRGAVAARYKPEHTVPTIVADLRARLSR